MLDQGILPAETPALRAKRVQVGHDVETGYWWAESEAIPGLVSEAETLEELYDCVAGVVPELLRANGFGGSGVRLEFAAMRQVLVA